MPPDQARSHWDQKYEQGLPSLEKPDPFFLDAFSHFVAGPFPKGGDALDLAGGVGRHALWLAKQSWSVSVVDISEVAIQKLAHEAGRLGVALNLFAMDVTEFHFKPAQFDLVVMFYHFDRDVCPSVLSTLRSGGLLICKSSVAWNTYEGTAPPNLQPLGKGEILTMLPGLQVLQHHERPVRDRGVVEYVGQKP